MKHLFINARQISQRHASQNSAQLSLHNAITLQMSRGTALLCAELMSETAHLSRKFFGSRVRCMPPVIPAGALLGRDSDMALLIKLIKEVSLGHGTSVLIEGEPGIGKSALVSAALEQTSARYQVFWGAGDELGQALPLQPFLDGLRIREPSASARQSTIVQLLRGEITADRGSDVPGVIAEQLLALVTEHCAEQPTVVVVDDLQWADQASVVLWGRLARSAQQMPLLLVGMMRPVPQRDDLLALRRVVEDGNRIHLTGLTEGAVAELVAALADGKPDASLLRLADDATGNPLYITELIAALNRSSAVIVTDAGAAVLDGNFAPKSLSGAIADRLGFATGLVRRLLRAAALLGTDFAIPDLAIVLGRGVPDLLSAVDEACAAGVLAESSGGLGFRHALIRKALYDEIPASVRTAWHRDAGRALAEADAPVDRVARQMLQAVGADAAGPMDAWMLNWLTRTGDHLVSQAPRVAADLLDWAVASSPAGSGQHGWLSSRLADALYRTGDRAQAEVVANRALEHTNEADLFVDLQWTLAQCRMLAGLSAESLATIDRALASPSLSARHRARLLVLAARMRLNLGQVERADLVALDALAAAGDATDRWAMGWALHVRAFVTGLQGHITDALPLYDQALDVTNGDPALTDLRLLLQVNKSVTLSSLDQYEQAFSVARQTRDLADQVGTTMRLAQAHGALGQMFFETGRWDDALAEIAVVPENMKEPAAACCDLSIGAMIHLHRGDIAAAHQCLAAAEPLASRIGHLPIGLLALARSLGYEQDDALDNALAALTDSFVDSSEEIGEVEDLLMDAVRLAIRADELDKARKLAGHAQTLAAGSEIPHRQANAMYCRGLLDRDPHLLLKAAERYGDASRPLLRAKALEGAAGEFVRADDRGQARAAFTTAVEVYTALGAAADVARLQAAFRAHGIRRGPHSKHRRASSGWDSLTPTEIKIAAFVEEGLSNPEIAARLLLSRRTVGTHVSHILKKLNVHSRTDIARESALRGISSR